MSKSVTPSDLEQASEGCTGKRPAGTVWPVTDVRLDSGRGVESRRRFVRCDR